MTFFERHPTITLLCLWVLLGGFALGGIEWAAKRFMGLGNPVVYQSHPIFGYRPIPNQDLTRFKGKVLKFNNLGLRADTDWDASPTSKILFLGDSVTYGGSYISNKELFSNLVAYALPQYTVGNGGVNAWGVENVTALVLDYEFMPAEVVVSTFPEGDFLRGLNRFGGQPFWPRKPRFALTELYYYYLYKLNNQKYAFYTAPLTPEDEQAVIQQAVRKLALMDATLKQKGYRHILFISPSVKQALGQEPKDARLQAALAQADLQPIYLVDFMEPTMPVQTWYTDNIHLSEQGHRQWAVWMLSVIQAILPSPQPTPPPAEGNHSTHHPI
jgi:lysophospholipase L1-like esterase